MSVTKVACEICGREISKSNYSNHHRTHEPNRTENYHTEVPFVCKFCDKVCKNQNSLTQHEIRCPRNPDRINTLIKGFNNKGRVSWCKGLTSDTDIRIKQRSMLLKERYQKGEITPSFKGRTHTSESKLKTSMAMKNYLKEHPDKVPYLLNHSSKISYPEQYFIDVFRNEHIDLKYHKQIGLYQLDFYNEEKHIDIEIDSEQHYTDQKIVESDKLRNEFLKQKGWSVFRIRWSEYKSCTQEEKEKIIDTIKQLIK